MQINRFNLFREDIEDLVKLTVDKMDMYHLIGALFLCFTSKIYTVGRIREAIVPPFFLGMYFLTVASALSFLLLAVWLSMHASISAHSFGVRLRTRYVRLPIPSLAQLGGLAAKLSDFEKQGLQNILRLPFAGKGPSWSSAGEPARSTPGASSAARGSASQNEETTSARALTDYQDIHDEELLGKGLEGFATEHVMVNQAMNTPWRHVQLFRKLQAKWQCYDAYARVAMSLGVNQISQSIQYYLLGVLLLQRRVITTAVALMFILQVASLMLAFLDIASLSRGQIICMQIVGALPVCITCLTLSLAARDETHGLDIDNTYALGPAAFFVTAIYFEMLLWVARPSEDEASLPRRFRTVLFLDVFGDVAFDPVGLEEDTPRAGDRARSVGYEAKVAVAARTLQAAWAAMRRWEAIPVSHLSGAQVKELRHLRKDCEMWRRMLSSSLHERRPSDTYVDDSVVLKSWAEMSEAERLGDSFAGCLVGPLANGQFYDLERAKLVDRNIILGALTLDEVAGYLKDSEVAVGRAISESREAEDGGSHEAATHEQSVSTTGSRAVRYGPKLSQVDRLPWRTMRRSFRTLQLCWLFLGVLQTLQLFEIFKIDFPTQPGESVRERRLRYDEARRLQAQARAEDIDMLDFRRIEVAWPYGAYFRPATIACLPGTDDLLVGSPSVLYRAFGPRRNSSTSVVNGLPPLGLEFALPRANFPAGAVAICAYSDTSGTGAFRDARGLIDLCLWAALEENGTVVALWPFGQSRRSDATTLPVVGGPPWQRLAGSILRCEVVAPLLSQVEQQEEWCILFAGWDGESLPVAAVPLPGWPSLLPPLGALVAARAEAPLAPLPRAERCRAGSARGAASQVGTCALAAGGSRGSEVVALNLGPTGRLWAVLQGGRLQAWDLSQLRSIGHWRLRGPGAEGSDGGEVETNAAAAVAVCEDAKGGRLLVVGRGAVGPELLEAVFPSPSPLRGSAAHADRA